MQDPDEKYEGENTMAKRKKESDFRYATGEARVPWAAVGECVNAGDINALIEFLIPSSGTKEYKTRLNQVKKGIQKLAAAGEPAGKLTLGSKVAELEKSCCEFLKAKYSCFLTNATAGFEIAYKLAGLSPGDEVIAPAITFIATILYPLAIGAKVVLADVDPRTINIDPKDVARKISSRTKVIIPVHIGGYPADMSPIMALARKHDVTVIEDAAHAFGAEYRGKMAGTIGHYGAFSFHEVKNVTSLGEGGILCTDRAIGKDFAEMRFVGLNPAKKIENWLYDVDAIKGKGGYFAPGNHSSTEAQAVVLLEQMKRLKRIVAERRRAAEYLTSRLAKVEGIIPPPMDSKTIKSTWHLYLLQVDPEKAGGDVQELKKKLTARGVVQIPHFAPLYKFSIMRQLSYNTKTIERSCPATEEVFNRRFTHLPLYGLKKSQLKYMADAVIESVEEMKKGT
jgi:dTDP-4-amino-4,6-dideoxygalactose transaminase